MCDQYKYAACSVDSSISLDAIIDCDSKVY